jgi:hypothetical protein
MTIVGVLTSVAAAAIVGWVVGPGLRTEDLTGQLLALTRPGLLDLAIAFAAGIAAGFATLRTEAGGALSGVAVSVTIEPPLAAIGLFFAAGNHDALRQAVLAMVTNFGALVVGATAAMAWWGFADTLITPIMRAAGQGRPAGGAGGCWPWRRGRAMAAYSPRWWRAPATRGRWRRDPGVGSVGAHRLLDAQIQGRSRHREGDVVGAARPNRRGVWQRCCRAAWRADHRRCHVHARHRGSGVAA